MVHRGVRALLTCHSSEGDTLAGLRLSTVWPCLMVLTIAVLAQ